MSLLTGASPDSSYRSLELRDLLPMTYTLVRHYPYHWKSSLIPKLRVALALFPFAHFFWSYPTWTQRSDNFLSSPWQALMCLKKHVWRLTLCHSSLHFSTENNLGPSCLSSESVPSWLFLALWSFLLLFSWNSAISAPLFWNGISKNGFCMDEKKIPPLPDPASPTQYGISMWKSFISHSRNK